MDFELPLEVRMLRDLVRRFVDDELIPIEMQVPEGDELPVAYLKPLQDKARKLGLWHLNVPKALGGMGLGLLEACVVQEEVARSKAIPFRLNELFGPYVDPVLLDACNEEQKQRFLLPALKGDIRVCFAQTEPDAGADPASMRTRAVRDGDSYVVNGTKRFISFAGIADWAEVLCVTDPNKRGRGGITCLMIDLNAPGVSRPKRWQTMMGDTPGEIVFDDVRVPVTDRLGAEGQGFNLGQRYLTAGRVSGQAAWSLGVAQRSLDMAIDYAKVRVTFGQPLAERQAIQFMVADSAMELRTARLLVYETAWKFDRGDDIRNESYMAKLVCTEMAGRIVDRALQILGGIGLTKDLPIEYFYRQIRSLRITEGASEVLRWRLGRNLMRERS
ncbi:MAG: acyl-CoA dehydrogenase [Alphaproteobacteria bacterium]|nr:acyl-CoA dehydrogenase [Alphaproteobacteria bacterium]